MKKIQFTIDENTLFVKYRLEDNTLKNLNNTNIITKEDLIFDPKYFKNNSKLVAGFLNVMVKNDDVKKAVVEEEDLIITTLELLEYMPSITSLTIKPDIAIDYDIHMAILKNDTLKSIDCYTIPTYLLERIDTTKSVKITTRGEVFFVSRFIKENDLDSYSEVYYKKKLSFSYKLDEIDYKDFQQFLSINMHLKSIYFEIADMDTIKNIVKILRDNKRKNISISLKGVKDNLGIFDELEDFIKKSKYIKKNNIKFKIDYTKEYKMENFFKLLNFTTVKYILIVVIVSCILGYGINQYDIYKSSTEISSISDDITDLLEEFEYLENEDGNGDYVEPTPDPVDTPNPPSNTTKPGYVSPYYKNYAKVISVLKETNPDTVGWLTVNNTTVNYPVVQATNNSYYLNHDFNRKSNSLGWVFMDYRNNPTDLDQNTVIYGHNIAQAKIMFGNLSATLNASWYNKPQNQYITFNTANGDMTWRIFSIYKIANTNDYLYSEFGTQAEFLEFANKLKSRSINDFGVEIKENDKILTLSTCQNSGKNRLVVHAVLLK